MKRAGLPKLKRAVALVLTSTALILFGIPAPSIAATIGSAPCVQNIDSTAGVNVFQEGNSCFVAFKNTTTYSWTPPTGVSKIDLLIVAGGGGGGSRHAGGGGAGGLLNSPNTTINSTALSITVGGGGAGGAATSSAGNEGANGSNSLVSGGGITSRTAFGGGGGGYNISSGSGASSGGGGCCGQGIGTAVSGQGFVGSAGINNGSAYMGGGGGGAGSAGDTSTVSVAGSGGAGLAISWVSASAQSTLSVGQNVSGQIFFAGGGGGSTAGTGTAGTGGSGGGANGSSTTSAGSDATSNTGGGGGGGGLSGGGAAKGGNGGSGVVLIRYSLPSFTNSTSFSVSENIPTSTNAATIVVTESSTITFRSSLDFASFTLVVSDSVTARIRFLSSPDFEAFADAGANNEYDLTVRATNSDGNFQDISIKINVTDLLEAVSINAPTVSGATYKGFTTSISILTNTPGKIRFFLAGKRIPTCLAISTTGSYPNYTATCSWKPALSGIQVVRAILTPTNISISPASSPNLALFISKRSNKR